MENLTKRINIGPWINVRQGIFEIFCYETIREKNFILNLIKLGPFIKAVEPIKNPKLIKVGSTFFSGVYTCVLSLKKFSSVLFFSKQFFVCLFERSWNFVKARFKICDWIQWTAFTFAKTFQGCSIEFVR